MNGLNLRQTKSLSLIGIVVAIFILFQLYHYEFKIVDTKCFIMYKKIISEKKFKAENPFFVVKNTRIWV
jgi:hypothetical protein